MPMDGWIIQQFTEKIFFKRKNKQTNKQTLRLTVNYISYENIYIYMGRIDRQDQKVNNYRTFYQGYWFIFIWLLDNIYPRRIYGFFL